MDVFLFFFYLQVLLVKNIVFTCMHNLIFKTFQGHLKFEAKIYDNHDSILEILATSGT